MAEDVAGIPQQTTKRRTVRGGAVSPLSAGEATQDQGLRTALSELEVSWLDKHFYPTDDDLSRIPKLDERRVYEAYRDPLAATLYGERLMQKGEYLGAAGLLERAAVLGSTYAYQRAAIAQFKLYAEQNGGKVTEANKDVLMARLQVARILGDHRASAVAAAYLPGYDMDRSARSVLPQVEIFMKKLGEEAQLLGVPSPGPDPRPNAAEWEDLDKLVAAGGGKDLVTVYRR